jgi:hypothetical protein
MMVLLVPNGPYRKQSQGINLSAFLVSLKIKTRSAAFGYFGHMWSYTLLGIYTANASNI